MSEKLRLSLEQANGELVELDNLSGEALSSFLAVVGFLKAVIEEEVDESKLIYRLKKGSALLEVESSTNSIHTFYHSLQSTVKNGSHDRVTVNNLRKMQSYFKNDSLDFKFGLYSNLNQPIDLKEVITKSEIKSKRSRNKFEFKLEIKSGLLNQIGGNNPNYHLDHGGIEKITIFCERDQAIEIRESLYKNVKSLVETKSPSRIDQDETYTHRAILDEEEIKIIRPFLKDYNQDVDLITKLDYIHNHSLKNSGNKNILLKFLKLIILGFTSEKFHQSELKTVLIISKSLKDEPSISNERKSLLNLYNNRFNKG
ncbi:hypothetical protein U3A58_10200 [Algoriphagus sp. C2-6-M1]|uniref:hypothetical protein n=1 Tax=Algoriphagus persicinus TaxID=3108754 RepID=UPI002B37FC78|nr:hypothetical protein [Algoriphagus sp. C2-6-M1]MEB2780764.1 hypothetical protein [Algoriphagus sp. C2-6-M1]